MPKTTFTHRPPKVWHKISVTTPVDFSEIAAAYLATLPGNGIEQIRTGEPENPTETIVTYLPDNNESRNTIAGISSFFDRINEKLSTKNRVEIVVELIEEEDWNSKWKEHFKPFRLTDRLLIKPSWEDYQCQAGELVLEMDPGMAFGTGLHASTRLALLLIEQIFRQDSSPVTVLDVGTGTGILGMSCALYGAKEIVGIDNDIDARVAAKGNIKTNDLEDKMTIDDHDLLEINGQFDLVIANITHDILIDLSQILCLRMRPEAHLVLSGILDGTQAESIIQTFMDLGLNLIKRSKHGEWAAFNFTSTST